MNTYDADTGLVFQQEDDFTGMTMRNSSLTIQAQMKKKPTLHKHVRWDETVDEIWSTFTFKCSDIGFFNWKRTHGLDLTVNGMTFRNAELINWDGQWATIEFAYMVDPHPCMYESTFSFEEEPVVFMGRTASEWRTIKARTLGFLVVGSVFALIAGMMYLNLNN